MSEFKPFATAIAFHSHSSSRIHPSYGSRTYFWKSLLDRPALNAPPWGAVPQPTRNRGFAATCLSQEYRYDEHRSNPDCEQARLPWEIRKLGRARKII